MSNIIGYIFIGSLLFCVCAIGVTMLIVGIKRDSGCSDKFQEETIFDHITTSPEVLTPYLVFFSARDNGWCSKLTAGSYDTYNEALAATLEKLKEVERG